MSTWKMVLIGSVVGVFLLLFPMTRFLIIRLFMLPAGMHWFLFLIFAVLAIVAGVIYYRHRKEQQRKERIRQLEYEVLEAPLYEFRDTLNEELLRQERGRHNEEVRNPIATSTRRDYGP